MVIYTIQAPTHNGLATSSVRKELNNSTWIRQQKIYTVNLQRKFSLSSCSLIKEHDQKFYYKEIKGSLISKTWFLHILKHYGIKRQWIDNFLLDINSLILSYNRNYTKLMTHPLPSGKTTLLWLLMKKGIVRQWMHFFFFN